MAEFPISGKVCIVTGGTEGIGLAIVERLLEMGASVMIGNRNETLAEEVLSSLRTRDSSYASRLAFLRTDVTSLDDNRNLVSGTISKFGDLDVVVANAGFSGKPWLEEVANG
ncbi:3-oxoacyl-[acyl-carrier-protein] reductase, partial [Gonapodya sp. JEL0774]